MKGKQILEDPSLSEELSKTSGSLSFSAKRFNSLMRFTRGLTALFFLNVTTELDKLVMKLAMKRDRAYSQEQFLLQQHFLALGRIIFSFQVALFVFFGVLMLAFFLKLGRTIARCLATDPRPKPIPQIRSCRTHFTAYDSLWGKLRDFSAPSTEGGYVSWT